MILYGYASFDGFRTDVPHGAEARGGHCILLSPPGIDFFPGHNNPISERGKSTAGMGSPVLYVWHHPQPRKINLIMMSHAEPVIRLPVVKSSQVKSWGYATAWRSSGHPDPKFFLPSVKVYPSFVILSSDSLDLTA